MPRLNANRYMAIIAAILGIGLLLVVLIAGKTVYGAKLNITIGPITLQPSEFVKILFVYFIAVLLYLDNSLKGIIIVSALAGAHMLILVMSKDLGNAAIFFIIYLINHILKHRCTNNHVTWQLQLMSNDMQPRINQISEFEIWNLI